MHVVSVPPRVFSAGSGGGVILLALAAVLTAAPTHAQQVDRERQQLLQLQQQLQKLRQENTQLQQAKKQEIEQARGEADKVKQEAGALRASGSHAQREARRLNEELGKARQALQQSEAEVSRLKADLAQRDAAVQAASQQAMDARRTADRERQVQEIRTRESTLRAERCEAKHENAINLGKEVIERYESRQLRACEPFTGLWRVSQEQQIQALRDKLFDARLDGPDAVGTTASEK